jgi:hypothetical protein
MIAAIVNWFRNASRARRDFIIIIIIIIIIIAGLAVPALRAS